MNHEMNHSDKGFISQARRTRRFARNTRRDITSKHTLINLLAPHTRHISERFFISTTEISKKSRVELRYPEQ